MQYPVRTGPITNNAAAFEPAMAQGSLPDRPRLPMPRSWNALKAGWQTSQTTHVSAPFSPDMSRGYQPVADIVPGVHPGGVVMPPDVPVFSIEMIRGYHPDSPVLPSASAAYNGHRGWWFAQITTKTIGTAPFGPEMVSGYHPDTDRPSAPAPQGFLVTPPEVQAFSVEMVQGWHPDQPYVFVRRPDWSVSQPTHTPAFITPDMLAGSQPDRHRAFVAPKRGWTDSQLTFLVQMTPEMFAGSHPDTSRAWIAPRIPLPTSQPTHVAAPLSPDMLLGAKPDQARPIRGLRTGTQLHPLEVVVFSVDMTQGWHPDTPRLFIAPRLQQPPAQTTHVPAPFQSNMTQGSHPDRGHTFVSKPGWRAGVTDTIGTIITGLIRMISDALGLTRFTTEAISPATTVTDALSTAATSGDALTVTDATTDALSSGNIINEDVKDSN